MSDLDKAYLNAKSHETGFIRDNLERVYRLTDVLEFVFTDRFLSERLILKGGTAINLKVFDLPRLSVDNDTVLSSCLMMKRFSTGSEITRWPCGKRPG